MAIRSGFFNSVNGDRKYNASRFAEYFASFIGNGVFPQPVDGLQVIEQTVPDMTVIVKAGKVWIDGYIMINDDDYILEIEPADGVLNRIDRIVARYDVVDREIRLEIKKGEFASSPVALTLQRDADAYELALADIRVNAGVTSISSANITDLRNNKDLCGKVDSLIAGDINSLAADLETHKAEIASNEIAGHTTRDWALEKIGVIDIESPITEVSFDNIDSKYNYFKLIIEGVSATTTARHLNLYFNNDLSNGNYGYIEEQISTTSTITKNDAVNYITLQHFFSQSSVNIFNTATIEIYNYNSNKPKKYSAKYMRTVATDRAPDYIYDINGIWKNAVSKITSIQLRSAASNAIGIGTRITLWGAE